MGDVPGAPTHPGSGFCASDVQIDYKKVSEELDNWNARAEELASVANSNDSSDRQR